MKEDTVAEKPAENKAEKAAETKAAETKAAPAVDIIAMERAGDVVYIADELVAAFERQGYTKKETK